MAGKDFKVICLPLKKGYFDWALQTKIRGFASCTAELLRCLFFTLSKSPAVASKTELQRKTHVK